MSDRLRSALLELGDQPPPAGLADRALARAHRDRRRRGATVLVTAVAAVAAVAVPAAVLRPTAQPPAAAAPTATPAAAPAPPVWVSGYMTVRAGVGTDPTYEAHTYDSDTRGYRTVPVSEARVVAVSPDGSRAVVAPPGFGAQEMAVVRLDRLAAGLTGADWRQRLLPRATRWTWSPDGTRLLAGDADSRPTRALVVDVRTWAVTEVPLRLDELTSSSHGLTWGPGGRGFLTWRSTVDSDRPGPGELAVYDEAGQPTRRYPMPGLADLVRLSPDGGRALVVNHLPLPPSRPIDQSWLVDLGTGATTALSLSPDNWYDDGHLIREDIPDEGRPSLVVLDPDGERIVRRTTLAVPTGANLIRVLVAYGPPPPGAVVV